MAKKPKWQQIAVLGAGSTSNFIFGTLFFIICSSSISKRIYYR
jgi:hypothetical protein